MEAEAVEAQTASVSARSSAGPQDTGAGSRIIVPRIAALKAKVPIIQYLDLVLILPPDSIKESSNIFEPLYREEELVMLDTERFKFVPSS